MCANVLRSQKNLKISAKKRKRKATEVTELGACVQDGHNLTSTYKCTWINCVFNLCDLSLTELAARARACFHTPTYSGKTICPEHLQPEQSLCLNESVISESDWVQFGNSKIHSFVQILHKRPAMGLENAQQNTLNWECSCISKLWWAENSWGETRTSIHLHFSLNRTCKNLNLSIEI